MREYAVKNAKIEVEEKDIVLIASAPEKDLEGEVIKEDAWILDVYKRNPVLMWAHDTTRLPIGRADVEVRKGEGLVARLEFDKRDKFAAEVERKIRDRYLNAGSVGYLRLEADRKNGIIYTKKALLLEVSIVPIPANPAALIIERSLRSAAEQYFKEHPLYPFYESDVLLPSWDDIYALMGIKGAVAPHRTPKAPEDLEWDKNRAIQNIRRWASTDGSGDPDKIDRKRYRLAFAWYNSEKPDLLTSYKLPHHDIWNGRFCVVWRGCVAGVAAVAGARGGVKIPKKDIPGVLSHFRVHYKQFDRPFPFDERTLVVEYEDFYTDEELDAIARMLHELNDVLKRLP